MWTMSLRTMSLVYLAEGHGGLLDCAVAYESHQWAAQGTRLARFPAETDAVGPARTPAATSPVPPRPRYTAKSGEEDGLDQSPSDARRADARAARPLVPAGPGVG